MGLKMLIRSEFVFESSGWHDSLYTYALFHSQAGWHGKLDAATAKD
jgi:hypothetical protein